MKPAIILVGLNRIEPCLFALVGFRQNIVITLTFPKKEL